MRMHQATSDPGGGASSGADGNPLLAGISNEVPHDQEVAAVPIFLIIAIS